MSMDCVASTLALRKSSSVNATYCPFLYSYPLTISFQGTSRPVFSLTRRYRTREKSRRSSKSKSREPSVSAEERATGILTNPKLMVPFQIGRPADFALAGAFCFLYFDFLRGMDSCSYSMDFLFFVVHALSLRCFTLTVRPRTALPLPVPRALFFLLFRRLRFIGGSLSQVDALSA